MTEYINKADIVKELERLYNSEYDNTSDLGYGISCGKKMMLRNILNFLDKLEAKTLDVERDIEKEISKFIDTNFEKATTGHKISLRRTARYFYELGLERALKANLKTNLKNK